MARDYIKKTLNMTFVAYAELTGVRPQYVNDQLKGIKPFNNDLYEAIGVKRCKPVVTYERISK